MERNEVLDKLPKHLMSLVIDQPYNSYTPQDHAVWRYVMRQNVRYLPTVAHHSYLDGLKRTGISIESIPHMYGMNRILKEIGWAAVAVDGFIPPSAFMEFQAYNVLVIAADIRPIDQIEYTPAPDIIHEAAGHAPILADPEYADYLKLFGEIGSKAFSSRKDLQIYNAIRHLSILKADPNSSKKEIEQAGRELALLESIAGELSEMALIRNLHWWTVEYGLIGDLKNPKIYGAGLLSSIGESYSSLQHDVKKLPYTVDAVNYTFDITTRRPQLFVTPDFHHLNEVLDEFACRMAWRRGGLFGLNKALESGSLAMCEYKSGLQVSGLIKEVMEEKGKPAYLKTDGPTALSYRNKQLAGHGKDYHKDGFGSPVGKLRGVLKPIEFMNETELKKNKIISGKRVELEFDSGLVVKGDLTNLLTIHGRNLLLSFNDCNAEYKGEALFIPSWGIYDMAVGSEISSVVSGVADPDSFGLSFEVPEEKTHKITFSDQTRKLHSLYSRVSEARNDKKNVNDLRNLFNELLSDYPDEWLLGMEILEAADHSNGIASEIKDYLTKLKSRKPELSMLIDNGFKLIGQAV